MHYICSESKGTFFTVVHTTLWEVSFPVREKIIISYTLLLSLDRVFSEFLEQILSHRFLRYWSWFEAFPCLHIRDAGGGRLKAKCLTIIVGIGNRFESGSLTHYSCYCKPIWKPNTYTLQWLFGVLMKAEYLCITMDVDAPLKAD